MKFRPHRGGLEESMAEVVGLKSRQEFVAHLQKLDLLKGNDTFEVRDMNFWDHRCGWDTFVVVVNTCAVGYTDGPLPE